MKHETCRIYFVLDGKDYAVRHWSWVPRVGDNVMFHPDGGSFKARVVEVAWNTSRGDDDINSPTINIALERLEGKLDV